MTSIPVILDGDPGTDDLVAWAWALARQDRLKILGFTTVHGNVPLAQTTRNALDFLHWIGAASFPVHAGADRPLILPTPEGDDAFGKTGLGDLTLPSSPHSAGQPHAVDWMADTLRAQPSGTVTLIATGPLTNVALLQQKHPDAYARLRELRIMGGAVALIPPTFVRQGNITPYAEFNFYMDPHATDAVLNGAVPAILLPLDATQQLVSSPRYLQTMQSLEKTGEAFALMLRASEILDIPKFGVDGGFLHDPSVIAQMLHPELFKGETGSLHVEHTDTDKQGMCHWIPGTGHVTVIKTILDSDAVYRHLVDSLKSHS